MHRNSITYHGRTVLSEILTSASVNMVCQSVLYLDNAEVPIFYKSVTLGTTFKSPVKKYIAPQKFQTSACHFWLPSVSEIWDRICATEEWGKITVT